jgi:hypothetical protein
MISLKYVFMVLCNIDSSGSLDRGEANLPSLSHALIKTASIPRRKQRRLPLLEKEP